MAIENPPAFPRDHRHNGHNGMTLRDWFAGQALTGLSAHPECGMVGPGHEDTTAYLAREAYFVADAMLAERAKATGEPR